DRKARLRSSPAILTGRIFDDRGNRMSPTHSTKLGVRYRYYVSHALLQKRPEEAGSVSRLPAPEIEARVIEAVRRHPAVNGDSQHSASSDDRDLVEQYVERVLVKPDAVEVRVLTAEPAGTNELHDTDSVSSDQTDITVPWTAEGLRAVKGILHAPVVRQTMKPEARDALLSAIAKARAWIDDLVNGRIASFAGIAAREGKVERHIRLLAPLAFTSPQIIAAIVEGTAPAELTVTGLAKSLPFAWPDQERRIKVSQG